MYFNIWRIPPKNVNILNDDTNESLDPLTWVDSFESINLNCQGSILTI